MFLPCFLRAMLSPYSFRSYLTSVSLLFLATYTNASPLQLPKPNGAYQVGVGVMELIDKTRLSPFAPTAEHRKLMISCFYPVQHQTHTKPVGYLPPKTAAFEDSSQKSLYGLDSPKGTFEKLALQLAVQPAPKSSHSTFPVVLFSPAEGTTRLFYSVIAQTVASAGYIVVTIDSPNDVDIVQYPDGSTALLNTTIASDPTIANINLAVSTRAQDVSFVLDQLSDPSITSHLISDCRKPLNVHKVAMFGHSLGGAATASAMLADTRIAGGINMDGALWGPVVQKGLDRPFMFMAHMNHTRSNDNSAADPANSWFDIWPKLRGWKLDIRLENSLHYTFSDLPVVLQTLGIRPNVTVAENLQVTSLNGKRALHIVTTYVVAFMDMVLKCKHEALLQGPVEAFPEVVFER